MKLIEMLLGFVIQIAMLVVKMGIQLLVALVKALFGAISTAWSNRQKAPQPPLAQFAKSKVRPRRRRFPVKQRGYR
jgi:hypothetical protein